jgi:hypothetical protein
VARVSRLLVDSSISEAPEVYVRRHGTVIAEFGALTQDSGNVSWLVDVGDRRLFVKTAGTAAPPRPGAPVPFFDHEGRVRLLRNAIDIAASCRHPALARLLHVIESPEGPALVYEAAPGELVGVPRPGRHDPSSAYQRFAHLPAEQLLGVFDVLIDLHVALAEAGWVACDLYDGCLILDFSTTRLTVVDLDSYRRGPSVNDMGRMFGATVHGARGVRARSPSRRAHNHVHARPAGLAFLHPADRTSRRLLRTAVPDPGRPASLSAITARPTRHRRRVRGRVDGCPAPRGTSTTEGPPPAEVDSTPRCPTAAAAREHRRGSVRRIPGNRGRAAASTLRNRARGVPR